MLSRLMKCTGDYRGYSRHRSTGKAPFFPETRPDARHTTSASNPEQTGLRRVTSPIMFISPLTKPTNYHFFTHLHNFLQGKHFHNQQHAENAFQESIESQSVGFYTIGIKNLFLTDKNVLIVRIPILINKEVFEPTYNDLNLTV